MMDHPVRVDRDALTLATPVCIRRFYCSPSAVQKIQPVYS